MNDVDLIARQRAREAVATEVAERKAAALANSLEDPAVLQLLAKAERTPRMGKRIRLVLLAASTWAAPASAVSACRRGCTHCCSLPAITITSAEARLLANASGRAMSAPARSMPVAALGSAAAAVRLTGAEDELRDVPCPFLRDNDCSVYEARPAVCRLFFNMDDEPTLCERVPDAPANVPYLDTRRIWLAGLSLQPGEILADIRDFFPQ